MAKKHSQPMKFKNLWDMARLPYFEIGPNGYIRTVARIRREFPIIDIHTHLAYSYFFAPQVPLKVRNRSAHFKMPDNQALDLDRYFFRELKEDIRQKFFYDVMYTLFVSPWETYHHTIPNLLDDMDSMGIRYSVILPIELPLTSNSTYLLENCRGEKRLLPFCSIHPLLVGKKKRLRSFIRDGARGLKFHPEFQFMPADSVDAMKLFELCAEERIPVLTHCGSTGMETPFMQEVSRLRHFDKPIRTFPEIPFILGHAGFYEFERAMELCERYPNAYLEMSGQPYSNVKQMIDQLPAEKVLYGSDWSWYHPAAPIANVFLATEGRPQLRRKILYENAARILGLEPLEAPAPSPAAKPPDKKSVVPKRNVRKPAR